MKYSTYKFTKESLDDIKLSDKGTKWPVVYFINNDKHIYIGETTNAFQRVKDHLANNTRNKLKDITIISNDKFNKSATLDIENNLIEYLSADNKFTLQNKNNGVAGHNYYQREIYNEMLQDIWKELQAMDIAVEDIKDLANTDIFKYSPYKALTEDQYVVSKSIIEDINNALLHDENRTIIVDGGAGTGKTVLAIYLMKLLSDQKNDNISTIDSGMGLTEAVDLKDLNLSKDDFNSVLVIPQSSLRGTIGNVFKGISGLTKNMVINASQIVPKKPILTDGKILNKDKDIKIAIVDEAHRLRRQVNISGFQYGAYRKNDELLQLEDGTELDWIVMSSQIQILFYDKTQSIRPTDIPEDQFSEIIKSNKISRYSLDSQMRVMGGSDYITYIDNVLNVEQEHFKEFSNYDFYIFDDVERMYDQIRDNNKKYELSRMLSGYGWDWISKGKSKKKIEDDDLYDITIDDYKYIWNSVQTDWVNSRNAINEIGSIHTIQGYDLNYAGVIFGPEITYNPKSNTIEIIKDNYKDKNGKNTIKDDCELKAYIINIYNVLLSRGIRGTYIYAYDENLQEYLKQFIKTFESE